MIDNWTAELVLSVIQYLNVRDNGRLAATSPRYYYLVHEYRRLRGPELAATSSSSSAPLYTGPAANTRSSKRQGELRSSDAGVRIKKMHEAVVEQLQAPPNLALCFTKSRSDPAKRWMNQLSSSMPSDTVIVNATAPDIQTCLPLSSSSSSSSSSSLEYSSFGNGTFMTFGSDVSMVPFSFQLPDTESNDEDEETDEDEEDDELPLSEKLRLQLQRKNSNTSFWSVFIVYAGGNFKMAHSFMNQLQKCYPHAIIVGGICDSGDVSVPLKQIDGDELNCDYETSDDSFLLSLDKMTNVELMRLLTRLNGGKKGKSAFSSSSSAKKRVDRICQILSILDYGAPEPPEFPRPSFVLRETGRDSIWGVALGGNVPVRSIASLGVKSLIVDGQSRTSTTTNFTSKPKTAPFYIRDAEFHRPGDDAYLFPLSTKPWNPPPFSYHLVRHIINRDTNKQFTPLNLLSAYGSPDFVGIQRVGANGYDLMLLHPLSYYLNAFILPVDINGEKSIRDANLSFFNFDGRACLQDMDEKMQWLQQLTKEEQILGAIMFNSSDRGPRGKGSIPEPMADANRFQKYFTTVPCCGFYGNGQIGPPPSLRQRQQLEQHFRNGNATLQSTTAIFLLWIVPKLDWKQRQKQQQQQLHNSGAATVIALLDDSPSEVRNYLKERNKKKKIEDFLSAGHFPLAYTSTIREYLKERKEGEES